MWALALALVVASGGALVPGRAAAAERDPSGTYVGSVTSAGGFRTRFTLECDSTTCRIDPPYDFEFPVEGGTVEVPFENYADCPSAPVPPQIVTATFSGEDLVLTRTQEGGTYSAGPECGITILESNFRFEGTREAGTRPSDVGQPGTTAVETQSSSSSPADDSGSPQNPALPVVAGAGLVGAMVVGGVLARRRSRIGRPDGPPPTGQPDVRPVADGGRQTVLVDGPALVARVRAVPDGSPRISVAVAPSADGSNDDTGGSHE